MKFLFTLLSLLIIGLPACCQESKITISPIEFQVVPSSRNVKIQWEKDKPVASTIMYDTITPSTPASLDLKLINRSKSPLWISHRWVMDFYLKDSKGMHMLKYPMRSMSAPSREDFVLLQPNENIGYQTQIAWSMLSEEDKKPGKKTFIVKVWMESASNLKLDPWTGGLSAEVGLNVAEKAVGGEVS